MKDSSWPRPAEGAAASRVCTAASQGKDVFITDFCWFGGCFLVFFFFFFLRDKEIAGVFHCLKPETM